MPRVFVSHGARDANLAAAIAGALRKLGVEAFDVSGNDAEEGYVRQAVKSAIRKADGFVLVLGAPDTAASSWTGYELGMADALGKPTLLLLSHKHAASELPFDLAGLPILPFDPAHPELAAREIVDRLLAAA
jgi:hypothetical protein